VEEGRVPEQLQFGVRKPELAPDRQRKLLDALQELRRMCGTQFCPRCVSALESIVESEMGELGIREQSIVDLLI
jgi:hypothetical protein